MFLELRPENKLRKCEMSTKVAINGLGRIGRAILKLVIAEPTVELVAVNDLVDVEKPRLPALLRHGF